MIKINLLPSNLSEKKCAVNFPGKAVWLVINSIFLVVLSIFILIFALQKREAVRLKHSEQEYQIWKAKSAEAINLKNQRDVLKQKMEVINQLVGKRILWAKKLNELCDIVPEQVWLTMLSINEVRKPVPVKEEGKTSSVIKQGKVTTDEPEFIIERYLILKGMAVALPGREKGELQFMADFMDRIKNHQSFYKDYISVEQEGPIRWDKIGEYETMEFQLSLEFK